MSRGIIPLYLKLKNLVLQRIASGEYAIREKIPTERELVKESGMSRITVIRALRELNNEGYLERVRGRGTIVIATPDHAPSGIMSSISKKVKITFAVNSPISEKKLLYKILTREFALIHPEIEVNIVDIHAASDYTEDKYLLKLASGNMPTVGEFYLHSEYSAINSLVPLEGFPDYNEFSSKFIDGFIQRTPDTNSEMKVHALPFLLNTRTMLINKRIVRDAGLNLEEPPTSWKDLSEWVGALGEYTKSCKKEHYGFYSAMPYGWHNVIHYLPYMYGMTDKYENTLKHFMSFLQPENSGWLKFIKNLHETGNPCSAREEVNLFQAGRLAMHISAVPWIAKVYKTVYTNDDNIAVVKIPTQTGKGKISSCSGDQSVGIFNAGVCSDEEKNAAWEWIKFLFSEEAQTLFKDTFYCTSPIQNFGTTKDIDEDIHIQMNECIHSSKPQFDFPKIRPALTILGTAIKNTLNKGVSPDDSLADAAEKIKEYHNHPIGF